MMGLKFNLYLITYIFNAHIPIYNIPMILVKNHKLTESTWTTITDFISNYFASIWIENIITDYNEYAYYYYGTCNDN